MKVSNPKSITQPIILFDGVCNLCNASVQFILKRDHKETFMFCPLQSRRAESLLKGKDVNPRHLEAILLLEGNEVTCRSTAALRIARQLKTPWPALYAFIVLPRFIRDAIYNFIARNRYKWFGKQDQCMVPSPQIRSRFLD